MDFKYDERKSRTNKVKHGINFIEAQALWDDQELLEVPLKSEDEPLVLLVGRIAGKHWSAIVTYREGHVRIISVRRSRNEEKELYES